MLIWDQTVNGYWLGWRNKAHSDTGSMNLILALGVV